MRPTVITSFLTLASAGAGFLGTKPDSPWYRSIDRPSWEPPAVAFPLVWTPLYGTIAWATGRAIEAAPESERRRLWALTAADLTANAGWCWAFFDRESPRGGLLAIAGLNALNLALVREAARHDTTAALALTPYAAWTGFATTLNASIWRRNR